MNGSSARASAPAALERARSLTRPALEGSLSQLAPALRRVAGYHLGFNDPDGDPLTRSGGKALRPALALLCAQAVGGPAEVAVPAAVAVELVHNFSLLHDDIMDGDTERRHRPTAWTVFGTAQAILAGDALLAAAHDVLLAIGGERGEAAGRRLAAATQELITGQVEDLAFESRDPVDDAVTVPECLAMAAGKTGALLGAATSIGALLAGAGQPEVTGLAGFGAHLGLAFQLVDDLLGIWGRPQVTGKPVGSDLRARKKSVPVVAALAAGGASGRRLAAMLRDARLEDAEEIALAAKLCEDAGGREWTRQEAARQLESALTCLRSVVLAAGPADELVDVARYVIGRDS